MILYPLRAPIFTGITNVWPRSNQAVVTNNSTVIIEVVLIGGFLYSNVQVFMTTNIAMWVKMTRNYYC